MSFNFPNSPSVGQIYNPAGGPSYIWTGTTWDDRAGGTTVFVADTPPVNAVHGNLWFESDSGNTFIWVDDGDSSQWVQVNVLGRAENTDAPADGGEYVRVNNTWRLSRQTFDVAGLAQKDIAVPSWNPARARLTGVFQHNSATLHAHQLRVSADGTNFAAGASDYLYGGFNHSTGTNAFLTVAPSFTAQWIIAPSHDHTTIPVVTDVVVNLVREGTRNCAIQLRGDAFNSAATSQYIRQFYYGYVTATAIPDRIRALRWMTSNAAIVATGNITVDWLP